jgi:hypothetical protein
MRGCVLRGHSLFVFFVFDQRIEYSIRPGTLQIRLHSVILMNDFARAFAARKKTLVFDALAFCVSAIILKTTGSALLFAVSGCHVDRKTGSLFGSTEKSMPVRCNNGH